MRKNLKTILITAGVAFTIPVLILGGYIWSSRIHQGDCLSKIWRYHGLLREINQIPPNMITADVKTMFNKTTGECFGYYDFKSEAIELKQIVDLTKLPYFISMHAPEPADPALHSAWIEFCKEYRCLDEKEFEDLFEKIFK